MAYSESVWKHSSTEAGARGRGHCCTITLLHINGLNQTNSAILISLTSSLLKEDLHSELILTILNPERPKLYRVLAVQSAIGLMKNKINLLLKSSIKVKGTGSKVDPYAVVAQIRNEKDSSGGYVFTRKEYMIGQLIASFLSRLLMKDKN